MSRIMTRHFWMINAGNAHHIISPANAADEAGDKVFCNQASYVHNHIGSLDFKIDALLVCQSVCLTKLNIVFGPEITLFAVNGLQQDSKYIKEGLLKDL